MRRGFDLSCKEVDVGLCRCGVLTGRCHTLNIYTDRYLYHFLSGIDKIHRCLVYVLEAV